ncbi:Basal-body rod modification protein FlgD [Aquicella siphonis]|uniref:Basal-body rod modification protein FlgD n=1 Tax=Aquicella siphonis TaxID=254247 RepID=A0A5E4PL15_9COXI|nr:FlgD immunoglobulin-like domain containing protein [Aquicella siphonis]VVC77097.1 Basal-body rod modification protein FlgD [Aquicella siphonis]
MTIIKDSLSSDGMGYDLNGMKSEAQGGKKELSKDDFMTIFLTQMRMQSPLKPYDSAQMLQQMSMLTSLTATEELQKTIQSLGMSISKSQVMSASQLIGKKVQIPSGVSPLVTGEGLSGSVILPGEVSDVTITIKDKDGKVVKTINKGSSGSGVLDFDWDGKDADGNDLKPDFYKISAIATMDGKKIDVPTAGTFKVGSVAMNPTNGAVILNVDGLGGVDMGEIIKIL